MDCGTYRHRIKTGVASVGGLTSFLFGAAYVTTSITRNGYRGLCDRLNGRQRREVSKARSA
nr:hypothetical protein [Paenibacillus larvae]